MRIQNEWMLQYIENWTKDKLLIALVDAHCSSIEVMEQFLLLDWLWLYEDLDVWFIIVNYLQRSIDVQRDKD